MKLAPDPQAQDPVRRPCQIPFQGFDGFQTDRSWIKFSSKSGSFERLDPFLPGFWKKEKVRIKMLGSFKIVNSDLNSGVEVIKKIYS